MNARSYFGARYYRAEIGRFTTIDPVYTWKENLADPQRWNRYGYVRNNPLRFVDPDGRCIDGCAIEIGLGVALYALATQTATYLRSPQGQRAVQQVVSDTGAMVTTAVGTIRSWFQADQTQSGPKPSGNGTTAKPASEFKIPKPGVSAKEGAKDVPSWALGKRPKVGESGKDFAERLIREKTGKPPTETGPGSEFNKIKKWGDRSFIDPPK